MRDRDVLLLKRLESATEPGCFMRRTIFILLIFISGCSQALVTWTSWSVRIGGNVCVNAELAAMDEAISRHLGELTKNMELGTRDEIIDGLADLNLELAQIDKQYDC